MGAALGASYGEASKEVGAFRENSIEVMTYKGTYKEVRTSKDTSNGAKTAKGTSTKEESFKELKPSNEESTFKEVRTAKEERTSKEVKTSKRLMVRLELPPSPEEKKEKEEKEKEEKEEEMTLEAFTTKMGYMLRRNLTEEMTIRVRVELTATDKKKKKDTLNARIVPGWYTFRCSHCLFSLPLKEANLEDIMDHECVKYDSNNLLLLMRGRKRMFWQRARIVVEGAAVSVSSSLACAACDFEAGSNEQAWGHLRSRHSNLLEGHLAMEKEEEEDVIRKHLAREREKESASCGHQDESDDARERERTKRKRMRVEHRRQVEGILRKLVINPKLKFTACFSIRLDFFSSLCCFSDFPAAAAAATSSER